MVRLSVNLNKVALIRNSRGADYPNLVQVALDCERYGDVADLRAACTTELNIEGYPEGEFIDVVLASRPDQVTLVPDEPGQLTSDHGWDTVGRADFLREVLQPFQAAGIRTSIFVDPDPRMIEGAKAVGTDRIEFYTGPFAHQFKHDSASAIAPFTEACRLAADLGLGINAGHDLNLENLAFFAQHMPGLQEVSIGHALVTDALYLGLEETIRRYLACLGAV